MEQEKEYHILSLSGGKDSTALAFYIKENMPDIHEKIEYVFCDTGVDLPETYDYLNKIEVYLNKKITYIQPEKSFEHLYSIYKCLPAPHRRWCTIELKLKPFSKFKKERFHQNCKKLNLYIGIRSDEAHRSKPDGGEDFVNQLYPFIEAGLNKPDIEKILIDNGINFPEYYKWSNRNGCYFCFYQTKMSWLRLKENNPELFEKAMSYEIDDGKNKIGWNMDMLLRELILPENIEKIKANNKKNPKTQNFIPNLLDFY